MHTPYRISQLWNVYFSAPSDTDLDQVQEILSPPLMDLFTSMHPSEQAHCIRIYKQLLADRETNKDLLIAALLHDVGKSRYRIKPWERVMIVVGKWIFPQQAKHWGHGKPNGLKRPFVIAEQHAELGAKMAEEAGASKLAVQLIRRHQDTLPDEELMENNREEERLLRQLQTLDNNN